MAYIFGLIVVGLLFLALHYFTELTKSQKLIVSSTFFIAVSGAIMYNNYALSEQQRVLEVIKKFQRGQSVRCNGIEINATFYDLSDGTQTFIGKENTPHYAQMVRASQCK
ncbi:MAG: hypothetical protein FAF05_01905 [Epsilonproteobacteria bacterium]|nr:hypothetical protein [Campylobacterota bacterium]